MEIWVHKLIAFVREPYELENSRRVQRAERKKALIFIISFME
jgi:hypothetical protein